MNSTYKIAAAVIGSFVLGVGAANVLHAQAKPPGFEFAEIDVKDQDGYTKDYLPKVQANIKESGANTSPAAITKRSASAVPRRPIVWFCYNSLIWMRSRRSTSNSASFRRT